MAIPSETVQVSLVFLLALEQPKAQIEMLQEIAGVLQTSRVVSALMSAKQFNDVIDALKVEE
jgi:PTS system galactitol-specific IIA component